MFKIPLEELIEEVKLEILSYEDINDEKMAEWETKFRAKMEEGKITLGESNGVKYCSLKDESDIFSLADNYLAALDAGEEDKYWDGI